VSLKRIDYKPQRSERVPHPEDHTHRPKDRCPPLEFVAYWALAMARSKTDESSAIETAVPAAKGRSAPADSALSEMVGGRSSVIPRAADAVLVQRRREAPLGPLSRPGSLRRMPIATTESVAYSAKLDYTGVKKQE
jgi:hypothetical protein